MLQEFAACEPQIAKAARTRAFTSLQSRSLRWPMTGQLRAVHCNYIGSEVRLGAPTRTQSVDVVGFGTFCRQNAHQNIGALDKVRATCNHNRGANLCFQCAGQHAHRDIARVQLGSSDSSASSRAKDADLKSCKSSSVHESDQSIVPCDGSAANRSPKPTAQRQRPEAT